jgi:hypothetical protein
MVAIEGLSAPFGDPPMADERHLMLDLLLVKSPVVP